MEGSCRVVHTDPLSRWRSVVLSVFLSLAPAASALAAGLDHALERRLSEAVDVLLQGQLEEARRKIQPLVTSPSIAPLAQALLTDLEHPSQPRILDDDPTDPLLAEIRARWRHLHHHPAPDERPLTVLQLAGHHRHVVLVDISESRLYVLANGPAGLRLSDDHYVTVGKNGAAKEREGDGRTPIGVYRITGFIAPRDLSPFYGAGALPLTYPNRWDQLLGRTGDGIWIHGNPIGNPRRPPRASDGCVTLDNGALESLRRRLDPGTPVIIAERLDWVASERVERYRRDFMADFERWRRDWESLDTDAYLSHYAAEFRSERGDLQSWRVYKRRVNARKRWIKVAVEDMDAFLYPGEANLIQVVYSQDYRSSNYRERSIKEQFWRLGADGRWRIVYEGSR